jgi:RecB family endonuclease NucS
MTEASLMLDNAEAAIRAGARFVIIDDDGTVLFTASTTSEFVSFWEFPTAAAVVAANSDGKHQLFYRRDSDPVALFRAAGPRGWDVERHP